MTSHRYVDNSADFFNTGDFGGGNNNNNNNNHFNQQPPMPNNNNNNNRNTFSVEDTTSGTNIHSANNNNIHQRKVSNNFIINNNNNFSAPTATNTTALPSHVRNRSGGTGGSGTPTTITSSTTPSSNANKVNNLGFDNTASFLSSHHGDGTSNGIGGSALDFGGRTLSSDNLARGDQNVNGVIMGRQNSSNSLGDGFVDEENELPLLEELGIRPDHIRDKVKLVLNPFALVSSSHELCMDEDLAGPLTFVICLGFLLTLQGKVHFGAIYGTSVVGMLLSYFLLSMMSQSVPVRTTLVISTLGYCLLPDLFLAIFVTLHMAFVGGNSVGVILPVLSLVSCAWSSWCAMKIFAEAFQLHHVRYLILYPAFLFYAVFAAITMF